MLLLLFASLILLFPSQLYAFSICAKGVASFSPPSQQWNQCVGPLFSKPPSPGEQEPIYLESKLTNDRVRSLFAWISRAFSGDENYSNLMLGMAAIFGTNLNPGSEILQMKNYADSKLPLPDEEPTGEATSQYEREEESLGAMGAGQWMGQFRTRPHALLDVSSTSNLTSVEDWVATLPRGCRRTLKKANAQNWTVSARPILGKEPAPHSSLAHFRCVVEHEVRLIATDENDTQGFLQALSTSVGRYVGTTRQAGIIYEYRNSNGTVIAFAHEVQKGRAIRGQWFYGSDESAKSYVWFHSVQELVRRGIEDKDVDVADLGPSGSDAFSELKSKYGFGSVVDWHTVADYTGPFRYNDGRKEDNDMMSQLMKMIGERL